MTEKNNRKSEAASTPGRTWALVFGCSAMALGAFATASVFSYHPGDPNLWLSDFVSDGVVGNRCGVVGANVAYHLVSIFGLAGFVLPVLLFLWGVHVLARRSLVAPWRRLAGAFLFVTTVATLLGAVSYGGGWLYEQVSSLNIPVPLGGAPRAGGLLGFFCTNMLRGPFGPVGSYLVILAIGLMALVLLAQEAVEWALAAVGRVAAGGAVGLVARVKAGWAERAERRRELRRAAAAARAEKRAAARCAAETDGGQPADFRAKRGRAVATGPDVRATFGQSEADMKRSQVATAGETKPLITIARVTDVLPSKEKEAEAERGEVRELAELQARAKGSKLPAPAPAPTPAETASAKGRKPAVVPAGNAQADPAVPVVAAAVPANIEKAEAPAAARLLAPAPVVVRQSGGGSSKVARSGKAVDAPVSPKDGEKTAPPIDYGDYELPDLSVLDKVKAQAQITNEVLTERGQCLVDTLKEFKIETRLVSIDRGPAVTIYELELAAGIRVQKVMELSDNLAMSMRAPNVRIIAPIPGRDTIGVEVPNTEREVVRLRPIIESKSFKDLIKDMAVPFVIGRDAAGEILVQDLSRMPHMLVAGATGSGKSVCLNSFIGTILMTRSPAQVRLLLVDPKMVEMAQYKGIPHLITPVITDMKRAAGVFEWATGKMEERYGMLSACGVRDIARYNKLGTAERRLRAETAEAENPEAFEQDMPYLVIIVDELADLMMLASKEIERSITRLAQKSRGVGIHIILATQRPSVDVVTGLIKTNMPARVAFQVASKVDSRTIIDQNGAEKLMGMGDMLFLPPTISQLIRAKGTYVSDEEVVRMVEHAKKQARPDFVPELEEITFSGGGGGGGDGESAGGGLNDDLFDEAVKVVLETRRGSVSLLQRRLGVGYTRAAKLIDMMAERNILGPYRGSKPREILLTLEEWQNGALSEGGVAGQRDDERVPRNIPDADDYNESEEFPEHDAKGRGFSDDDEEEDAEGENEPETATSTSGRYAS